MRFWEIWQRRKKELPDSQSGEAFSEIKIKNAAYYGSGKFQSTPNLIHTITAKRCDRASVSTQSKINRRIVASFLPAERRQCDRFLWALFLRDRSLIGKELDTERRNSVREKWERLFLANTDWYRIQFYYLIEKDPDEKLFSLLDAIVGINIPNYNSDSVAHELCEFLAYYAKDRRKRVLIQTDIYNQEHWLCVIFAQWRSIWEQEKLIIPRSTMDSVWGIPITGDK